MVGVFSWNDVDVLFTFNFDLKLSYSQDYKRFVNIIPMTGTSLY